MVIEAQQRSKRGDDNGEALASPETRLLPIAIDHHQRVQADCAVVDEDAVVHLADVDPAILARRDQPGGVVEMGRNAEIAREMVESPERQDPEPRSGPDQRRGRGADRSVAAADDQQRIAAFGDGARPNGAVAAREQLDFDVEPGRLERIAHFIGERIVGGERAAVAV